MKEPIKKKRRFTEEEVKKYIEEVFNFYGNPVRISENQFKEYFKKYEGLTDEEIYYLRIEACWDHGLINIGVRLVNGKPEIQITRPNTLEEPSLKEIEESEENHEE